MPAAPAVVVSSNEDLLLDSEGGVALLTYFTDSSDKK